MLTDQHNAIQQKARNMYDIFLQEYGERSLIPPRRDPMTELIMTMLSHRTTQQNEKLAFERMWEAYSSWEAIRDADEETLAKHISLATFPEPKARNIKSTLKQIIEARDAPNIDFLEDMPIDDAVKWLRDLPGVGIKTATLVLLFNFGKQVIPVDTHVHRVSLRTGLLPEKTSAEKAHTLLLDILPDEPNQLFTFHKNCLRHGQVKCTWSNPKCASCPIQHLCDYYADVFSA